MMATSRCRRVAGSGAAAAVLAVAATLTGQGSATAAPAADNCAWAATAARLLEKLQAGNDPRAEGIRTQLLDLGFGQNGQLPARCAGGTGGGGGQAGSDEPLQGAPETQFFAAGTSTGRVIPVSGGSIAAADPQPGDVVEIAAGTYDGFTPTSGADGAYVTYRAAPGAKVVVSGGGGGESLIDLDNASWVHLDGISVQGSGRFGIHAGQADHVAFTGVEVADSQDGGLVITGSSNIYVDGCNIHGNNAKGTSADSEGLSIEDTTTFEVLNTQVHDNGEEGVDTKYGAADGVVHHNQVWGNRGPNVYVDGAEKIDIHHNWVWGATSGDKAGIMLAAEPEYSNGRVADITIRDNHIWGNAGGGGSGIKFWVGDFSGVEVKNNILGEGNDPPGDAPSGVSLLDNVTGAIPAAAAALTGGSGTGGSGNGGGDNGGPTADGRDGGGSSNEEN